MRSAFAFHFHCLLVVLMAGCSGLYAAAPETFLAVGPRAFEAAARPLVEWRARELPARFVALEDVLAQTPGVDDPEKLKRYLYQQYREQRLRYVLLIGDADVLPVRYMVLDRVTPQAFDYAFYPSDLYYADVADAQGAFESWNHAADGFHAGYFGEVRGEKNKSDPINYDGVHYRPELAVGRWPVSTAAAVETVVAKTLAYERQLASAVDAPPVAGLLAIGGWVENRGMMDGIAAQLPTDWRPEKRYFVDAARDDHTPPPSAAEVVKLFNNGAALILHSGHGADDAWAESFGLGNLKQLQNTARLPIVFSAGCSTARFATLPPYEPYLDVQGQAHKGTNDGEVFSAPPPPPACYQTGVYNRTGLGEQLVCAGPMGAVAYVGCNTGSQPCGMTLMAGFVRSLAVRPDARLGDAWAGAVTYYYDAEHLAELKPNADWYPPSIFFQGMKFMLYGDPALRLPAAKATATKSDAK